MNKALFFFLLLWVMVSNEAKVPCIEPTVGTQHSAGMSTSINALMKRDVASLIIFSPGRAG